MDTIEGLCGELEAVLSSVTTAGFGKVAPEINEKLEKLSSGADQLGMKTGKKLIDNFIEVLKSFQAGKADENSVSVRFTALDFYKNNIKSNGSEGAVEDL
jgi:hypothetical protein